MDNTIWNLDMANCITANQILSILFRGPLFQKFLYTCICDIFTKCFWKQFATMYMMTRWAIFACLRASYTICRWTAFFWTVDAKITRLTFYKYMTAMIKRKRINIVNRNLDWKKNANMFNLHRYKITIFILYITLRYSFTSCMF